MTNLKVPAKYAGIDNRDVKLGRHVIFGHACMVHPCVTAGEGVAVGALSVLENGLGAGGMYIGRSAKRKNARSREFWDFSADR